MAASSPTQHRFVALFGILASITSFFGGVAAFMYRTRLDNQQAFAVLIVVSQNHISVFITYYFVEEARMARANVSTGHPDPLGLIFIYCHRLVLVGKPLRARDRNRGHSSRSDSFIFICCKSGMHSNVVDSVIFIFYSVEGWSCYECRDSNVRYTVAHIHHTT